MEADGLDMEQLLNHRRKKMLAGMLLHMIEAARPVDFSRRVAKREGRVQHVHHAVVTVDNFVDNFAHGDTAERTDIEGLAARAGIECSAVEHHAHPSIEDLNHASG